MQNYYVRFGRRHPIPSTVEILDELRSGYVPGYVRKSWAQYGFTESGRAGATLVRVPNDPPDAPIAQAEWCKRYDPGQNL